MALEAFYGLRSLLRGLANDPAGLTYLWMLGGGLVIHLLTRDQSRRLARASLLLAVAGMCGIVMIAPRVDRAGTGLDIHLPSFATGLPPAESAAAPGTLRVRRAPGGSFPASWPTATSGASASVPAAAAGYDGAAAAPASAPPEPRSGERSPSQAAPLASSPSPIFSRLAWGEERERAGDAADSQDCAADAQSGASTSSDCATASQNR